MQTVYFGSLSKTSDISRAVIGIGVLCLVAVAAALIAYNMGLLNFDLANRQILPLYQDDF